MYKPPVNIQKDDSCKFEKFNAMITPTPMLKLQSHMEHMPLRRAGANKEKCQIIDDELKRRGVPIKEESEHKIMAQPKEEYVSELDERLAIRDRAHKNAKEFFNSPLGHAVQDVVVGKVTDFLPRNVTRVIDGARTVDNYVAEKTGEESVVTKIFVAIADGLAVLGEGDY